MTGPQPPFGDDPAAWAALLENVRHAFMAASAGSNAPVNWELAGQLATGLAGNGDPELTGQEKTAATEALRLADLWLDPVTIFPAGISRTQAWNRLEWVKQTQTSWRELCDPVAAQVVAAMTSLLTEGDGTPNQLKNMLGGEFAGQIGSLSQIFAGVGGVVFGAQVGQGIGTLSKEVLAATDIGLPLGEAGVGALVPANLAAYAGGLQRPLDEVRLYVALREAAHHRIYQHVPWLRGHVFDAVTAYARG
ncbi:MAG: zinc-dependent metalloprotease, partial [Mycobacteriales bacterium]